MPRAYDPSLVGQQLPVNHNPLDRIEYRTAKPEFDLEAMMAQVTKFVEDYLFPVIEDLTGIDLSAFLPLFTALDLSSPAAFVQSLVDAMIAVGVAFLGPNSPLNALNLFNLVPTDLLSHMPASNIGTYITNLIADPHFLDGGFAGTGGWLHDLTGGLGGTGTAYTVADGTLKELLGNLIPVSEGQVMPISGRAKWTGLLGTGNPIMLAVTGYNTAGDVVNQTTVASHNTTPPTTDWTNLAGTFTVPAGVSSIRTRLSVGSTATAGTVSFSMLSATKTQPLLQRLIAGTNPGEFLPDDVAHLFTGITTNALALLQKAGLGDFNDLLATIGGTFGDDIAAAEQRLDDFLHSLSPLNADHINTGTVLDQFVPGVGDIHDSIVTAVGNLTGSGFDLTKMFEALTGQTHSVVDAAAGVTNLFGRLSNLESKVAALPVASGGTGSGTAAGGMVGVNDYDNFERVNPNNLGTDWIQFQSGAGKWAIPNGHDAEFVLSGTGNTEFVAIRNLAAIPRSQTYYQRVTLELSSKATRFYDPLLGTYNYCGFDDIWLRISDATTSLANITGIRIRYGGDGGLYIHQFVNGAATQLEPHLGQGGITPPGPGANLIGEAGILADGALLAIRAKIGASIRLQANTTVAPVSTSMRWGHGGRAEGHLLPLPGQEKPGGAHYWNGMDQTL